MVTNVNIDPKSAAWADLDGDGDMDVVVAGGAGAAAEYYENLAGEGGRFVEIGATLVIARENKASSRCAV